MSESITFRSNVHTVIQCEECAFEAEWYQTAIKEAEEHHRQTGHELRGEQGLAVWVGEQGKQMLEDRVNALLGPPV